MGELPEKLPFLKGVSQVCSRLPAKQADVLLAHMQQALAGQSPEEADPEWQDYWDFLATVQERASKGAHPRSAIKGVLLQLNACCSRSVSMFWGQMWLMSF